MKWVMLFLSIVLIFILLPVSVFAEWPCYFYGTEADGYIGKHHAAYYHGKTPLGFSDRVVPSFPGAAVPADWGYGFSDVLRITLVALPKWAEEEYSYLIGRQVYVVVVDRPSEGFVDLWEMPFRHLTAQWAGEMRLGKVYVEVERVGKLRKAHVAQFGNNAVVVLELEEECGSSGTVY